MARSARSPVRCGHGAAAINASSEPVPGLALDVVASPYQRADAHRRSVGRLVGRQAPFVSAALAGGDELRQAGYALIDAG